MLFAELVRLDDPEPHSAALNMAIDEALLRSVEQPLLRCYRWERPAVSFGYFGKVRDVEAAWPGRDLVRRWTGGGTVPHGEDFTYSLIIPRTAEFCRHGTAESYRAIHEVIAGVLDAPGLALADSAAGRISDACFQNPVRHDLLAGASKIAGAAQRRTRGGLLHQGSIRLGSLPSGFPTVLAEAMAEKVEAVVLPEDAIHLAERLVAAKYGSDEWFRRA